jgi:FkbM family methyltransferase
MERARHYVTVRQRQRLLSELRLPNSCRADLGMLQVLASVKAYLGHDIDILVDVGAHKGNFVIPALHILNARLAICFEPNTEFLSILESELENFDAEIHICALSDREGSLPLYIHQDSSMSSLLASDGKILSQEFSTYDGSKIEETLVPVSTLDLFLSKYTATGRRFFLKLDTQGNELSVLRGGANILGFCDGVLTEYMFTTPYKEQASFEELSGFLQQMGFRCAAVLDIKRKRSHRVSGVDFLFLPF